MVLTIINYRGLDDFLATRACAAASHARYIDRRQASYFLGIRISAASGCEACWLLLRRQEACMLATTVRSQPAEIIKNIFYIFTAFGDEVRGYRVLVGSIPTESLFSLAGCEASRLHRLD